MGETLINNLIDEKSSYKISLISKNFIDDNMKNKYEKRALPFIRRILKTVTEMR